MRPGSTPSLVNPVMLFQPAICTNLQSFSDKHKHSINGSLSKDGKICWMYSGSILEVVSTDTHNRLAAWNFGLMLHDSEVVIQCVAEYWAEDSLRLLVGLKNSSIAGLVCVLNLNLSRVVKAIEIPFKVTSIECITSLLGNDFPVWAFSEHLSCFYGIVAVGTEGGHVYLIDMCLDTHDQSDEMFPNTLHYISPDTEDVVQTRHEALSQRQVLCMELGMDSFSLGSFNYHSNDESVMKSFKTDEICVTCLKYMSRNGLLAVGYNFGCFQLWRLSAPLLEYSSRLDDSGNVPITHIAYQEPENDPKNFSYIWVARGAQEYSSNEGYLANITLYQLSFNKRMWYSNKECFYEEMSTIGIRLEHDLSSDPLNPGFSKMCSSNIINCYTLEDPYFFLPARSTDDSHEETSCNPDLSLCVFVWRADNGMKSGTTSYHLAIFDMNRWYHAQMPSNIRTIGSLGICPYMAFCSLDEVIDITLPEELLCAYINPRTVRKFISDPGLIQEQYFYPSALQFDVLCHMESGLINARYLGMQRQVLSTIQKLGPSSLIDPNELYKLCLFAGLTHQPPDAGTQNFSLTNYNREAILTLCLEHHLINVITKTVELWADGEYLPQGCTLKFLLDWTWNRVIQIKHYIDDTCKPFYDWSGLPVDERCVQVLHRWLQKLFYLTHILKKFIHTSAPITENGIEELSQKLDAVQLLSHHLKAVIWFVESALLPENDELASFLPGLYRYPRTNLIKIFMKRREELQQLHSDVKASELLMVDGLIENTAAAVRDLWQQDGGDGLYPPPSINALINIYLLDDVPLLIKHCIISYFLLDLASLEDDNTINISSKVTTFADLFSVPSATMNLITGFWFLDHKDFEMAFSFLVNSPVFGPWQHKQVIKALLYQNEGKLALRYLAVKQPPLSSPEEVKLKLTTFLVNGMTAQAVEFQRTCCDQNNAQDLISHIFLGCQQTKTMDQLLKLPLTELEEKWLENYLLTSMESHSEELLVMFYLQRARFVDAIRLNERLKTKAFGMMSAKDRERASTRNAIVNGCAKLLPEVQRQLIFEPAVLPRKNKKDIECLHLKPLSTMVIKSNPSKLMSQSTFVMALIEKMQEVAQVDLYTSNRSFSDDFEQRPIEPFISTPITPKKKSPLSDLSKVVYERNLVEQKSQGLHLSPTSTPPMASTSLFSYDSQQNQRPAKYVSTEAAAVLRTPIIHRKSTPRAHITSPRPTPQSILKVRQISNKSPSMRGTSPVGVGDKDTPEPRPAIRLAKLNLNLNDSLGTPTSTKKTKLLRFVEPIPTPSPVSVHDSPTPNGSHAFPSVTSRTGLTQRKSLTEMILTESGRVSETLENDGCLETDEEMEEEEVVSGQAPEYNVEERTTYMHTDAKDDDISDEISNNTEADESKEEDEQEDEAMEVEEEMLPISHVHHPVQNEPEVLVFQDQHVAISDFLTSSKPIDLTEEEEDEEFKPFKSNDILELGSLRQESKLSEQFEESARNLPRLIYEAQNEVETELLYDEYMEEEEDGISTELIESERDDVQIITEPILPQGFNEDERVNAATDECIDIVEKEDDDEEVVQLILEEEEEEEEDELEVVEIEKKQQMVEVKDDVIENEVEEDKKKIEEEEEIVLEEEEEEIDVVEGEKELENDENEIEVKENDDEENEIEVEEDDDEENEIEVEENDDEENEIEVEENDEEEKEIDVQENDENEIEVKENDDEENEIEVEEDDDDENEIEVKENDDEENEIEVEENDEEEKEIDVQKNEENEKEEENKIDVQENEKEIEVEEKKDKGIEEEKEIVEEEEEEMAVEENRMGMMSEEKGKLMDTEQTPEEAAILNPLTLNAFTLEPADLSAPPSPSDSVKTRNSSHSSLSTSSSSQMYTRRSLRSKAKVEAVEETHSETGLVSDTTKSVPEPSSTTNIGPNNLLESVLEEVATAARSTRLSKSSETRSTSLKTMLESAKKDLFNLEDDSSENEEDEETMSESIPLNRLKDSFTVKSDLSKQEDTKIETRSSKLSRTVTPIRRSSRLKSSTPSRETTPTREAARSRGTTPTREAVPSRGTTPTREAVPSRETTPTREVIPLRGTTPTRESVPIRETTPTRETARSRGTTPPREAAQSRGTTPPREAVPSRGTTPPREAVPSRGTTPPREAVPSRGTTPPREAVPSRGTTPPREAVPSRGTTPPREAVPSRGTTPPREAVLSQETTPTHEAVLSQETTPTHEVVPSLETTSLSTSRRTRILPVRTSTLTRAAKLTKVSEKKTSSSPLVNIDIDPQNENKKVEMDETILESKPIERITRRTTRKTIALKLESQSESVCETPKNEPKPFVFSPPITRKKAQKKDFIQKNVKNDSSIIFTSTRSKRSFIQQEPEEMVVDEPVEKPIVPDVPSSNKTPVKTRSRRKVYLVQTTDSPIVNLLTPSRHKTETDEKIKTRTAQSRILRKPAHSMVLRTKAAVKKRKL